MPNSEEHAAAGEAAAGWQEPAQARKRMYGTIARNFVSQLLSLAVSFADRFVLAAILLRVWPTGLYAEWTMIIACTSLLGLAEMGFVTFRGNRLHKAFTLRDNIFFERLIRAGAFIYCCIGLAMLVILLGLAALQWHTPFLITQDLKLNEAALVLLLLGLAQILRSTKGSISQTYRGRGEFARGILVDNFSSLLIIASLIAAAASGATAVLLALVYMAAEALFGWGIFWADLRTRYPSLRFGPQLPRAEEVKEVASALRWYSLSHIMPQLWVQAPVLILGFLGLSGVAVITFVVHRTLVNFCRTFVVLLSTSAGVELAVHVHTRNTDEIRRGIQVIGRIVGVVSGIMVGGLLTFGGPFIELWTGKASFADEATLLWLAVPAVIAAPAIPLVQLANLADLPKPLTISQVTQTVLAIILTVLLAQQYGSAGVAFSLALAEVLAIGVQLPLLLQPYLGIRFVSHTISGLAISLAMMTWGCAVGFMIMPIANAPVPMLLLKMGLWVSITALPLLAVLLPAVRNNRMTGRFGEAAAVLRQWAFASGALRG